MRAGWQRRFGTESQQNTNLRLIKKMMIKDVRDFVEVWIIEGIILIEIHASVIRKSLVREAGGDEYCYYTKWLVNV